MQLILLAAGKGTRLPRKFRSKPKCLVKINNKNLLDYNLKFFNNFKKKIIITGFKSHYLKKFIKEQNFIEVKNKKFSNTNMVYSAFSCHNLIKEDVVICYSDIIFDSKIYKILKEKKNLIPLKKNWLEVWKKRMNLNQIKNDAEDIEVKNNKLISIGGKILNKLPKIQYMGLIKLKLKDYHVLKRFFFNKRLNKVSFTEFINLSIKEKLITFKIKITNRRWYEIDTSNDIKFVKKEKW